MVGWQPLRSLPASHSRPRKEATGQKRVGGRGGYSGNLQLPKGEEAGTGERAGLSMLDYQAEISAPNWS